MLEVTILKVTHSGVKEARKIIPFIEQTDVFGIELAYMWEAKAQEVQDFWHDSLSSGVAWNKSSFQRKLKGMLPIYNSEAIKQYSDKICEYAYHHRKPLYFLERFSPHEAKRLDGIFETGAKFRGLVRTQAFFGAKLDDVLEYIWDANTMMMAVNRERDMEMGRNLSDAESNIRGRYKNLAAKDTLRFVLGVGNLHSPEAYTNIPCSVHNLAHEDNSVIGLCRSIAEGKSFADNRPLILNVLAKTLGISNDETKKLNPEELETRIKEIMSKLAQSMHVIKPTEY